MSNKKDRLRIEYVSLSTMVRWERNPKLHDIGSLAESIRRHGFKDAPKYEPTLNGGQGGIVDGNGRIETLQFMQQQNREPPRGIAVVDDGEWAVPVQFGVDAPSERAAESYAIDVNNLTMAGGDFMPLDMARMWDETYIDLLEELALDTEPPITIDGDDLDMLLWELREEQEKELPGNGESPFSVEQIIEAAFQYFRKTGFPYPDLPIHSCMQEINKLSQTDYDRLTNTAVGYRIADTYHPHRFHAAASEMCSVFQSFEKDKSLQKSLRLQLDYGGTVSTEMWDKLPIVSGTQSPSNFRPGLACKLYRDFCDPNEETEVLDTSMGYGGRLVGFIASGIKGKYIGIDPDVRTYEGNIKLAADLEFSDRVEFYNLPAEDVDPTLLRNRCSFAFTSPPYFAKEHYSYDDTQSWVRYKTGDEWYAGFVVPMMALQFEALKPGAHTVVNVADVMIKGRVYPLEKWIVSAGLEVGFEHVRTDYYPLHPRFGSEGDEKVLEPLLVFKKPG